MRSRCAAMYSGVRFGIGAPRTVAQPQQRDLSGLDGPHQPRLKQTDWPVHFLLRDLLRAASRAFGSALYVERGRRVFGIQEKSTMSAAMDTPRARRESVTKTVGGVTFEDPYAWLHADTQEALAW